MSGLSRSRTALLSDNVIFILVPSPPLNYLPTIFSDPLPRIFRIW